MDEIIPIDLLGPASVETALVLAMEKNAMQDLIFYVGAFDVVVIAALGFCAAALTIAGKDNRVFWDRILPACVILIGTSIAAGIVMAITRWFTGT